MAYEAGQSIDTTELIEYAQRMAVAAGPELEFELAHGLWEASTPIVVAAKALASWSTRIPDTIKAVVLGKGVVFRAGGGDAPHAKPFEHGGSPGNFRHPVFGNREVWVNQMARPFILPALAANRQTVEIAAEHVASDVLRKAGYH